MNRHACEGKFYDSNFPRHLRPFELEKCLFPLSFHRCSLVSIFCTRTSIELTRKWCLQAKEIKFANFQNLSCHHPRPDITFCLSHLTSSGERKIEQIKFQFSRGFFAKCELRIISFVLERQAVCKSFISSAIFCAHFKWEDEEPDTWWKCKHSLLPLTIRICVIECLLY